MTSQTSLPLGRLTVTLAIFVVVGTPLLAYLWETLNVLMTGVVDGGRLLLALPVAALFVGLLLLLARVVRRWEGEREERVGLEPTERPERAASARRP